MFIQPLTREDKLEFAIKNSLKNRLEDSCNKVVLHSFVTYQFKEYQKTYPTMESFDKLTALGFSDKAVIKILSDSMFGEKMPFEQ